MIPMNAKEKKLIQVGTITINGDQKLIDEVIKTLSKNFAIGGNNDTPSEIRLYKVEE